jgi:hypothetical protein
MVEWSKTLRSGRNLPWRRGFKPHSCQSFSFQPSLLGIGFGYPIRPQAPSGMRLASLVFQNLCHFLKAQRSHLLIDRYLRFFLPTSNKELIETQKDRAIVGHTSTKTHLLPTSFEAEFPFLPAGDDPPIYLEGMPNAKFEHV